ncbi:MAG: hypothetical protein PVJ57_09290 [Phycisphaerae bacterium]|jgi:hypothetical protein
MCALERDNLDERLGRIESQNRWLRGGLAATWLAIVLVCVAGQSRPAQSGPAASIEAQRFVLVGPDGKTRAVLGFEKALLLNLGAGNLGAKVPGLFLYDSEGNNVAHIAVGQHVGQEVPGVCLFAHGGEKRHFTYTLLQAGDDGQLDISNGERDISLNTGNPGGPVLTMRRESGQFDCVTLGALDTGEIGLRLCAPDRVPRKTVKFADHEDMELPVDALASAEDMARYTQALRVAERLRMFVTDQGAAGIHLKDDKGQLRTGIGCVDLVSERTGMTQQQPPSSLTLFGTDGAVLWRVP